MKIAISSDSTCDLPPELLKEFQITSIPLHIVRGENDYRDGIDITPDDIFSQVDAGGPLCSTVAVNVQEYFAAFTELRRTYDAVIHINLGSGFSSCWRNACIAAQTVGGVWPVDSQNLSSGQAVVVMEACRLAKTGTPPEDIAAVLNAMTQRVESCFLLERLDYLAKGGRCSSVLALGANMLKLRPCIEVADGGMRVGKRYRGPYDKCLAAFLHDRIEGREDLERAWLFLPYSTKTPQDEAVLEKSLKACGGFERIVRCRAGCTISCHCGPHTFGMMALRKP